MNQKKKHVSSKTNEELEEDKMDLLDKCNQIFAKIRQDFNMKFPTDQYIKFDRQYANAMKKEFDLFALCIEEVSQTYEIDGEKMLSSFINNVLITMKVMLFTQLRCFLNYLDQTIQNNDAKSLQNWESSEISKLSRHKVKVFRGTVDEDVIKAQEQNLINDPSDEIKKRLGVSLDPLLREYAMSKQELVETLEEKRRNLTLKESKAGRYLHRQIEGIKKVVSKEKAFATEFEEKHLSAIKKLVFSDGVTQVQGILNQLTEDLDQNAKKKLMRVLEYLFNNAKDVFAKKNVSCQTQIVGQTIDGYESQITKLNKNVYEVDRNIEQVLKETLQKDSKIIALEKQITFLKQTVSKDVKSDDHSALLMQQIEEQNKQIEKLNNQVANLNVDRQSLSTQINAVKRELEINLSISAQQNQDDINGQGKKGNAGQSKGKNNKKGGVSSNQKSNKTINSNPNIKKNNLLNEQENDIDNNNYEQEEEINNLQSQKLITSNTLIQSPIQNNQGNLNTTNSVNSPTGFTSGVKISSNISRESFANKDSELISGVSKNINTPIGNTKLEQQQQQINGQSEIKSTYQTEIGTPQRVNQQQSNNQISAQPSQFINQISGQNQASGLQFEQNNYQQVNQSQKSTQFGINNTNQGDIIKIIESKSEVNQISSDKLNNIQQGDDKPKKSVSIHKSSNKKLVESTNNLNATSAKHSKNNSIANLNSNQEDKQANLKSKSSIKESKNSQVKGSKKVSSNNSLHSQNELNQDILSLAQVSNQHFDLKLLDDNQNIEQIGVNNDSKNNKLYNSAQQLSSLTDLGKKSKNDTNTNNNKTNSSNKITNLQQQNNQKVSNDYSSDSQQKYTKQLVDQITQVPSQNQLKSQEEISSQSYLDNAQFQNQNSGLISKPNHQIRGSNFTGTQNSLIQTKDTDLTSIQTIPQIIQQGIDGFEENQLEKPKSKLDLNDILDALDLNQEEEEKKQSTKILQILTNKENPKRREIINSIVNILNQNGQLKTPRSDESKDLDIQRQNQKISSYTGFTSSEYGQTQYKKTQNSINSTPYSTQQNMRYHNASDHKSQDSYYNNNTKQKNAKFIESNNIKDQKYFKSENTSLQSSQKELEFKNQTLEKIDQNLNESSLNTSLQGKQYSGSQSQHDLSQLQKVKKYATQVSFKDLQVKPVDQEHLKKIIEKQEVLQDIIRKKNQIAMSRFQGSDSNITSYRDVSMSQELNPNQNASQMKRNLSNFDQKRGQYLNQWKVKDEFRLHDPKSTLQYLPNHTTSQSTNNHDLPRKGVSKFIPGIQNQLKKSVPYNEQQQFTQELYSHFQSGKIDFSKLKELELTSKQVKSQTNLNTLDSTVSGMNTKYLTTGKTDIGFNEFHEYYSELIQQHRKCGPMCIHLKRFYEKLEFNYKQYEKRQFLICPTLVVQEIPKEHKREPTKFNLTSYPASCSKI